MRSSLLVASAAASLMSFSGLGCAVSSPDSLGLTDAETAGSTATTATAIVVVERTVGPGDRVTADGVVARFVRVRQGVVDDPALRIAGVAQSLPALGTCAAPDSGMPARARAVELLDVGTVSLTPLEGSLEGNGPAKAEGGAAKATLLFPRSMPDPAGVVSGVFYSTRSTDVFVPGERVSLQASGGPDLMDGFLVGVTAPRDLGEVRVTSMPAGLDVSWDPEPDADDSVFGHLIYVDVLSPSSQVLVRCSTLDTGRVIIPAASVGIDEGNVAVHRMRRESFRAKGIEPGEVRFDLARVVGFRR